MKYLIAALFIVSLFFTGCYTVDESMFLQPTKLEKLTDNFKFNDVYFSVNDCVTLNAWYLTKENPDAIIYFLHGNSRNLYSHPWTNIINSLSALNVDIFAIDYRGYGKSTGDPSFQGLYEDAEQGLLYLQKHNPKNKPIIVYGLSMGSIPAVTVASKDGVSGLILEGALSSTEDAVDATKSHFWLLHLVHISYDKNLEFDCTKDIKRVSSPVFIIHGKNDNLPEWMSTKLFDAAVNSKKQYWLVEDGVHCDTYKIQPDEYIKRLSDFIMGCGK